MEEDLIFKKVHESSFKSFEIASDVQLIKIKQHNVCVGFKKNPNVSVLVEEDPHATYLSVCLTCEMLDVAFE